MRIASVPAEAWLGLVLLVAVGAGWYANREPTTPERPADWCLAAPVDLVAPDGKPEAVEARYAAGALTRGYTLPEEAETIYLADRDYPDDCSQGGSVSRADLDGFIGDGYPVRGHRRATDAEKREREDRARFGAAK